ncbi:MAG: tetratricopeptide repeat protein [Bacteroidales bacterium]|nr:tetratricopeptide repeat protein [Bacteroidales bacterium]
MRLNLILLIATLMLQSGFVLKGQDSLYLQNAELALMEGNYERAIAVLNEQFVANSPRYNKLKGVAYEGVGRYDSALVAYGRLVALDSTYIPALKGYARNLLQCGKTRESRKYYERILRLDSLCANTRLQYAGLLKREGFYVNAFANYYQLTRTDSTNSYYWELRADCALLVNNPLDAINSYNNAIRYNNQNLDIVTKFVKLLVALEVPTPDIIAEIDTALKVDSLYLPLLKLKGKLYVDQKKYKRSYEIFQRVCELGDSSTFTLKYLAISKFGKGLYYQSIPDFEMAYARDSSDSFMNFVYSSSLLKIGDRSKALGIVDYTERLLTPDSSLLVVLFDLKGDLYFENKNYQKAIATYRKAQSYSNGNVEFLFKVGLSYYSSKEYATALRCFEDYIDDANVKPGSEDRKHLWLAKQYIDKIKEEAFFRDTIKG